jgi:hypothetical protein
MVLQQYKLPLTTAQQDVVLRSLHHPDEVMKRRTLSLLCTVAEAYNAEIVCTQVADHVHDHCAHNPHLQHDLVSRAVALTDKFPNSQTHWHIAMLIRLLALAQDKQAKAIQRRIQLTLLAGLWKAFLYCTNFKSESLKGRNHLGDSIDRGIIIKYILQK